MDILSLPIEVIQLIGNVAFFRTDLLFTLIDCNFRMATGRTNPITALV